MESVFVELARMPTVKEVKEAFCSFEGEPQRLKLPTAPEKPIVLREEVDRPQPRFDKDEGKGISVVIGRVRADPILTVKYTCLGHNTIRGAAGTCILNAEFAYSQGLIKKSARQVCSEERAT